MNGKAKLKWSDDKPDAGGPVLRAGPFTVHRRGKVPERQGATIKTVYILAFNGQRISPEPFRFGVDAMAEAQRLAYSVLSAMEKA